MVRRRRTASEGRRGLAGATLVFLLASLAPASAAAAPPPDEDEHYRLITVPVPGDIVLEVGGLDWLDRDRTRLLAATRRGELWVIDGVYDPKPKDAVRFKRMLFGLHEPLGLLVDPGHGFPDGIYMAQRGELTRAVDEDGDDRIDLVETFAKGWEISGSYHEYAFGPKLGGDGKLWVTLNRPFGGGQEAAAYWRGWAVRIGPDGSMEPVCPGLRSPAGLGANAAGDVFFTDNQGDHVAVCKLGHLETGAFHGNPVGLQSCDHPESTFRRPTGPYPRLGLPWGEAVEVNPGLRAPAVWFPYPRMGKSHSDVVLDTTGGRFGPFGGQIFVGDQGNAIIVRVFLEKVGGEYQGACFPFRRGFMSGVLRMCWGRDGSMFVGGTNRGWGGGPRPWGLQRLVWTGKTPFEVREMRARHDGFELEFTLPVDPATAGDAASYAMRSWTYHYHGGYGDKPRDERTLEVREAIVSDDGVTVRLVVDGLAPYFVHELRVDGVRDREGRPVLHPEGYYTLNRVPGVGEGRENREPDREGDGDGTGHGHGTGTGNENEDEDEDEDEDEGKRPPNVVVILADDMGYECVSANGGTSYRTPVLDRLAAEGMRFTHCYSQPICTPSRVQLMTGIYNQRNYVRFGLLHPGARTFAHVLRKRGYATCVAGKWQLLGGPDGPRDFGFDEHCLWQLTVRKSRYPNPVLERDGRVIEYPNGEYGPDVVTDFICDFIERKRNGPFLVYYPMILPHWPFEPTPDSDDWDPRARGVLRGKGDAKYFADMVAYTDKMVGKVVRKIDQLGLGRRTLVLFTCDNGTAVGITSRMGDRVVPGGKGSMTDAGTHVPLIARWPGVVPAGRVVDDLIDFSDFFPTVIDAAGARVPDGVSIDGRSFLPQLRGETGEPREWVYCWYSRNGGPTGKQFARTARFKLYGDGRFFDLERDWLEQADPLPETGLSPDATRAHRRLQAVLEGFAGTRHIPATGR